ncbi:MAG: hypothetical protein SVK08_00610 [Halobacteriota archaeon]|nr:hypothetical protein [Halobacteriota archaeon]
MDFIINWDNYHERSDTQRKEAEIRKKAIKKGVVLPRPLEVYTGDDYKAEPVVNHGRWVIRCPFPDCNSAEFARDDELFLCQNCYNSAIGRKYIRVIFPIERQGIEETLLKRMKPHNRNWTSKEEVKDLIEENKLHGIEV